MESYHEEWFSLIFCENIHIVSFWTSVHDADDQKFLIWLIYGV